MAAGTVLHTCRRTRQCPFDPGKPVDEHVLSREWHLVGKLHIDDHRQVGVFGRFDGVSKLCLRPYGEALRAHTFCDLRPVGIRNVDPGQWLVAVVALLSFDEAQRLVREDDVDNVQLVLHLGQDLFAQHGERTVTTQGINVAVWVQGLGRNRRWHAPAIVAYLPLVLHFWVCLMSIKRSKLMFTLPTSTAKTA